MKFLNCSLKFNNNDEEYHFMIKKYRIFKVVYELFTFENFTKYCENMFICRFDMQEHILKYVCSNTN